MRNQFTSAVISLPELNKQLDFDGFGVGKCVRIYHTLYRVTAHCSSRVLLVQLAYLSG